jgi:uncharacterized repeat protein (TIGR01451 family)
MWNMGAQISGASEGVLAISASKLAASIASMQYSKAIAKLPLDQRPQLSDLNKVVALELQGIKGGADLVAFGQSFVSGVSSIMDSVSKGDAQGAYNNFMKFQLGIMGQTGNALKFMDLFSKVGGGPGMTTLPPELSVIKDIVSTVDALQKAYKDYMASLGPLEQASVQYKARKAAYEDALWAFFRANHCPPLPPCPPPPKPPKPDPGPKQPSNPQQSVDPNAKLTTGVGAANFVRAGEPITYTVLFENQPTATLPAQEVVITDQLDSRLDWSSVELGNIGFNNVTIVVPPGVQTFTTNVSVTSDPNPVSVNGSLNPATGLLTWVIQSVDAVTGQSPSDPLAGFLPPDTTNAIGEGFVTYSVSSKTNVANGSVIYNQAQVVFDANAPLLTPIATNTIDSSAPLSTVTPLPSSISNMVFAVRWSGSDPGNGSGLQLYNVYVSTNGTDYVAWLVGTTNTSAAFTGVLHDTYSFYSVAVDNVGNVQSAPRAAEAVAQVVCGYSLNLYATNISAVAGIGSVTVSTTDGTCAWTTATNAAWLHILDGASGTGSGIVTYSAEENCSGSSRVGTMTIAGQTFTVTQNAGFSLSATAARVAANAGAGAVNVVAVNGDCSWSAYSTASWITILSGSNGVGDGTVQYSIATNSTAQGRVGAIQAAGRTFTITQAVNLVTLAATYNGLVFQANAPVQATSGTLKVVLSKKAVGAATLSLGGKSYSFQANFDAFGNATNSVPRATLSPVQVILHLDVVNGTEQITGTVSDQSTFTVQVLADRAQVYSAKSPTPWAGTYTCLLWPTTSSASVPQGIGFGTLKVNPSTGLGAFSGILGDGTVVSLSMPVSKYGTWPMYKLLYSNGGGAMGWVQINNSVARATVDWFKPAKPGAFYPGGFATTLSLTGHTHVAPTAGGQSVAGSWHVIMSGGNLPGGTVNPVTLTAQGAATVSAPNANKLKLKVVPATGAMSGSFVNSATKKTVAFKGLLLQSPYNEMAGFFSGTNQTGMVEILPGL